MVNSVMPIPPVDTCAAGYRFYQCSDGGFSGCCSTDPCGIKICPVESSPSMTQAATSPSTTLVTSTIVAETSIFPTTTASVSTFESSTYLAPLTATATASSLSGTSSPVALGSSSSSSGRVNTSGAIIGGVVGGVLVLISLITAVLFWSRMRKRSRATTVKNDHEKWANDEFSSSGRCGYGDSIFDSYLSNGNNDAVIGLVDHRQHETLSPMSCDITTNTAIPNKPTQQSSACVFAGLPPRIVESSSGSTKYFHIPTSSSPRFFKYVDSSSPSSLHKSCSAQTDFSDSSEQISVAGGVPVPRSTRSVSGRSMVTGTTTMYAS